MTAGIDVFQKYQGTVNWAEVRGAGLTAVFVKLTNGASVASPAGDTYVKGARAAGIQIGGYAYVLAGSATAQADAFAAQLTRLNALDLAPALDFEDSGLPATAAARRSWIVSFFARLKVKIPSLDRVLLYSSGSELVAMDAGTITVPGLQVLIWDAEYGSNDGVEHPRTHYTGAVAVHQYTSVGRVAGITGNVDRNTIYTDITAEDDMALTSEDTAAIAAAVVSRDEFRALAGRVLGAVAGRNISEWVGGPVGGEENLLGRTVGARLPSIGAKLDTLSEQVGDIQGGQPPTNAANGVVNAMTTDADGDVDLDDLASKLSSALGPDATKALAAKLAG